GLGESGDRIELHTSDVILRRDIKRSGAWKLRIAMPVPIPAQRQTAKICALSHVQQCSRVPTLNRAMAEHRGFPRENRSMISSHLVVQGSGGEVHDNGIL